MCSSPVLWLQRREMAPDVTDLVCLESSLVIFQAFLGRSTEQRNNCVPCLVGMKSHQAADAFGCFPGSILGAGREVSASEMRFPSTHLLSTADCSQLSEVWSWVRLSPCALNLSWGVFPLRSLPFLSLCLAGAVLMRSGRSWCVSSPLKQGTTALSVQLLRGMSSQTEHQEESVPFGGTAWVLPRGNPAPRAEQKRFAWVNVCAHFFPVRKRGGLHGDPQSCSVEMWMCSSALLLRAAWKPCGREGAGDAEEWVGFD